jgi:hypothetical protein
MKKTKDAAFTNVGDLQTTNQNDRELYAFYDSDLNECVLFASIFWLFITTADNSAMTILTVSVVAFICTRQPSIYEARTEMMIERATKVQSKETININSG